MNDDCAKLVTLLLKSLGHGGGDQCCCSSSPGDQNYAQALIRFNETSSQVAADKLQSAYDRQQDRWHVTLRQNAKNSGVDG